MSGRAAKARALATVALPSVSVVVAALVFLGPGATAATLGARVYGAPREGASRLAVRIVLARSLFDVLDSGGAHDLLVEGSAPGQTLRAWRGSTDEDGVADAELEATAPLHGPVALAVTVLGVEPRLAVAGELPLSTTSPLVSSTTRVAGIGSGGLGVEVDVPRGVLAAAFTEAVRIRVTPPARADLTLSGLGVLVDGHPPTTSVTDAGGVALLAVQPTAHQVDLTIDARGAGATGRWEATLPVVPGAMWLDPRSDSTSARRVVAPGPRTRAYASLWSDAGRVAGRTVALAVGRDGFFEGSLDLPDVARSARPLVVTLAGDPLELGAGTVAWPLVPAEGAFKPPPLVPLLDGIPAVTAREEARAKAARRVGLWVIGAAALAEILLLLEASRASQRKLEAHMRDASSELAAGDRALLLAASRESPVLRALLAVALVALAFALFAAIGTFR